MDQNEKCDILISNRDENEYCLGETRVYEKSNEITVIPELLDSLNIKEHIITTDAKECQTEIVKSIRSKHADFVLALKRNHVNLYGEVRLYFDDHGLQVRMQIYKVVEKARGDIEKREYWQADDIAWLTQKKDWAVLTTMGMTKNTITKNNNETKTEVRYFISSLPPDINEMAPAIRGHRMIESYHITFPEDANHTIDKDAAYNLNIIKKNAINTLKLVDVGIKRAGLKMKRYVISVNFEKYY